jgi:CDP-diacylglycerol--glycerol-3-phosphate 3-phosphatidyltransferase
VIYTIANILTLSRVFLAPLFLVAFISDSSYGKIIATLIFGVAAFTDYLDGAVARKYGEVTDLGNMLDPLADKALTGMAFVAFWWVDVMPLWMVIVIILRDFLTTALRSFMADEGHPLVTSRSAKAKTMVQMVVICGLLLVASLIPDQLLSPIIWWVLFLLTGFTTYTFVEYVVKNRSQLRWSRGK